MYSPLTIAVGPWVSIFFVLGVVASLCLAFIDFYRPVVAANVGIWVCYVFVFPYTNMISMPLVTVVLIAYYMYRSAENFKERQLAIGAFRIYLGAIYFLSGFSKFQYEDWVEGRALGALANSTAARVEIGSFLREVPPQMATVLCWSVLLIECLAISMVFRIARIPILVLLALLHVGVSIGMRLFDLSIPFLLTLIWLAIIEMKEIMPEKKYENE
jgi:uncharacterized membrane protein YphA (DoxX/SURF4 family)